MKHQFATLSIAACVALTGATASFYAKAQSDTTALSTLSALPMASVIISGAAASGAALAVPVALSTAGGVLVVRLVEVSARGTVYVLERASDGVRTSVEIAGSAVAGTALSVGTLVTVSVIGSGVVLSAAGDAIAFLPNALGRALLHNERLTQ